MPRQPISVRVAIVLVAALIVVTPTSSRANEGGGGHGGGGEGEAAPGLAAAPDKSDHYVHNWIKFPTFKGPRLEAGGEEITVAPKPGRVLAVVFVASWCVPCQQLMPKIMETAKKYGSLYTDIHFVFAHDTREDALGFAREYKIVDRSLHATLQILKDFHNPALPSIFVADRHAWLLTRFTKANEEFPKFDRLIALLTSI